MKPLEGANEECLRFLNLIMCSVCAPGQDRYVHADRPKRLIVCHDFCNHYFKACGLAKAHGRVISEYYAHGNDFCMARNFEVAPKNQKRCFKYYDYFSNGSNSTNAPGHTTFMVTLLSLLTVNHVIGLK